MSKVNTGATATQKLETQKMEIDFELQKISMGIDCLLYTSPSPRDS